MMLRNSNLMYIVLWLLVQLLVIVNCKIVPSTRRLHTATLIDNKLYILGGFGDGKEEFIYLDFSCKFSTQNLTWKDLSSINPVPGHGGAASVKGGTNNDTLLLYGGESTDIIINLAPVYTFDPQNSTWSTPEITAEVETDLNIIKKKHVTGVVGDNGKMYLWGGWNNNQGLGNDMLILDTINLSWGKGSSIDAPAPKSYYGATLLSNQKIIYMGGYDGLVLLKPLNQVYIYDTINDSWSTKETSGIIPSNRYAFSAVPGLDGKRIIIFGGTVIGKDLTPEDSLYVLNLKNFKWYIPKISGQIPKSRMFHKANVIGGYMAISFGSSYNQSTESDILLLDISDNREYIWTNDFDPSKREVDYFLKSIIEDGLDAIAGTLFSVISLLSFMCFLVYKWNKYNRKIISAPVIKNKQETISSADDEKLLLKYVV